MKHYHLAAVLLAACKTSTIPESNPPQIVVGLVDASVVDAGAPAMPNEVADWEIQLSRSICYGFCPEYTIVVKSDGTVEYDGRQFVSKHGRASDRIAASDAKALLEKFEAARFDRLEITPPGKCSKGIATDAATNVLTVKRRGGGSHSVEHYLGNMCAPTALLVDLANAVDATAKTARWTKCGPPPDDYCTKP